jgi:hypothetical protein
MDQKRANVCHAWVVAGLADFGKFWGSRRPGHWL